MNTTNKGSMNDEEGSDAGPGGTARIIANLYLDDLHPLQKDAAALPTRPLEEFVNIVRLWLDNLLPGGLVWSHPRIGKTQGLRYLGQNAEQLLGAPIPVTLLSNSEDSTTSSTKNQFLIALLTALDHGSPHAGTAAVKRTRAIDFMVDRVRSAREHRYLLLIDEAQWLTSEHFRVLMDLHNQLKFKDIRLITVLVGQPELLDIKRNLRISGQNQLLGRFMTAVHRFEGVVDQADFVRLCRSFDEHSEWPEGSGITFTQYFVPKAWDKGWRLQNSAVALWEVISRNRRRDNLPAKGELPMQALIALLRWILQTLHDGDDAHLVLGEEVMEIAYERVAALQIRDHFGSQDDAKE